MYREKRRNKIIILILVCIICLMGIGYAAFQTQITVTGVGNVSGEWSVRITNVEVTEEHNGGTNKTFSFEDTTAELEADLYNKGDYVLYTITVANEGDFDAKLETLGLEQSTNDAVLITSTGLTKGQSLLKGESTQFTVKIEYNSNYVGDATGTSGMADLTLNFVQNSGGTIIPSEDYLVTYDYQANGGTSTNAENAYLAEGEAVNLNYAATKENAEFLGWNTNSQASEGLQSLTMPGNDIILYAIFKDIDTTPPVITNVSTTSTINSITIVTTATEEDGEIDTYEYSIDNGNNWVKVSGSNSYTFTNLKSNTEYTIMVRVYNESDGYAEENVVVSTKVLNKPTFSEEKTESGKTVTITYPEGEGLVYQYQKNSEDWQRATQGQKVEFTESGTLVAKVSDGTNVESATYSVNVITVATDTITHLVSTNPNELYKDNYDNIRYYGSNPNNYVSFNDGEMWRIIGVIDGKIKIIRNDFLPPVTTDNGVTIGSSEGFYWNYPAPNNNDSYNNWDKSTLKSYLNGTYLNSIERASKNMIFEEIYYLGGPDTWSATTLTANDWYSFERSNTVYNGNPTTTTQYIGLMYPSDYGYAAGESCLSTSLGDYNDVCMNNDYLYKNVTQWTITPRNDASGNLTYIHFNGFVSHNNYFHDEEAVFPVLYLKSETIITGGDGSESNPFTLKL